MIKRAFTLTLSVFFLFCCQTLLAQDGSLDLAFGINGIRSIFNNNASATGSTNIELQPDKKILVSGYFVASVPNQGTHTFFYLTRLNPDGTTDLGFATSGIFTKDLGPFSSVTGEITGKRITLQQDGKIVATSSIYNYGRFFTDVLVMRFNSDGSPDNSFASGGFRQFDIGSYRDGGTCAIIQPDGKIIVGGGTNSGSVRHYFAARLHTTGITDSSFYDNGIIYITLTGSNEYVSFMQLQTDGKIVMGGSSVQNNYNLTLIRLNTNGYPDVSFNGSSSLLIPIGVEDDMAYDIDIQSDNKIVVAGFSMFSPNKFVSVARVNPNGTLDNTFDGDGKQTYNFGNSSNYAGAVNVQTDGKILIAGGTNQPGVPGNFAVMRLNTDGTIDNSFNGIGRRIYSVSSSESVLNAMMIQPDGKVLLAGKASANLIVARTTAVDPIQVNCDRVAALGGEHIITISGLGLAPNGSIHVFDKNWTTVYNQSFSYGTESTIINSLPAGTYNVKVSFFNNDWTPLCQKEISVIVTKTPVTPVISIESLYTATETNGLVYSLIVSLSEPTNKPVTISYRTVDGTAKAGSDYVSKSGTFSIATGRTGVFMDAILIDDNILEPDETFTFEIFDPINATLGNAVGTVLIKDNDQPAINCGTISTTHVTDGISISGLNAPVVTVQVLNESWATVFSNSFTKPDSIHIPLLSQGKHMVTTRFYTASWNLICEKIEFINVDEPVGCPPGAICITNICNNTSVNLDSAYSILNLPSGVKVSWHTASLATDNNRLTPAQAQNITQSGSYYAAINIAGSNCYSATITVVVTIKSCGIGGTAAKTSSIQLQNANENVQVMPNPFKNSFRMEIVNNKTEVVTLALLNSGGNVVQTFKQQLVAGKNQVQVHGLENLSAGVYFLRIVSSNGIEVRKVMKGE